MADFIRRLLVCDDTSNQPHTQARLSQSDIPADCIGHSYQYLCIRLIKEQNCIPLGLLRPSQALATDVPYVVTNPPGVSTTLKQNDKVFLISPGHTGRIRKWGDSE